MRRMKFGNVEINWNDIEVLKNVARFSLEGSKEVAKKVEADAKRILKQKAKHTTPGGLLSQFDILTSKYKDSYAVICQGPANWHGKYHASFVELGTYKDTPKPFMRPARKKWLNPSKKIWEKHIEKGLEWNEGESSLESFFGSLK